MSKTYTGWISPNFSIHEIAGAFRTDGPRGTAWQKAVLTMIDENVLITVWEWRYRNSSGNWLVTRRLYTEQEMAERFIDCEYEKHAGPFEVSR